MSTASGTERTYVVLACGMYFRTTLLFLKPPKVKVTDPLALYKKKK
jgi:hypothetical protein